MKSLKKNYAYSMVYQVLQMILPLVTAPYISRVLGKEGVGTFSYTNSIAYYFMLFGMLGINNHGNRSIAQVRDDKKEVNETFSELFSVQLLVSVFCLVLYIFVFIVLNDSPERIIYIAQLPYVLSACFDVNWLFFGLEEFKITVTRKVVIKLLTTVGVFIFIRHSSDVIKYTWIMTVGYFVGQCYLWISIKKYISFTRVNLKKAITNHLKPLLILFIPILATSVYRVMDKVMLGAMDSKSEVGLYENADKIVMVCLGVVTAWGNVMLPRISNLMANEKNNQCSLYLRKSLQFINCITIAIGVGLFAIASKFSIVFFGNDFANTGIILSGLSFTIIIIGWSNTIRNQVLIPMKRDSYYVRAIVVGAALNLIVNASLIPIIGGKGAMVGTILAELVVAVVQIIPVRKTISIKQYLLDSIPFVIMGIVMLLGVVIVGLFLKAPNIINISVQILCGVLIYCTMSAIYFIRHKDSFGYSIVKRVLNKIHIRLNDD